MDLNYLILCSFQISAQSDSLASVSMHLHLLVDSIQSFSIPVAVLDLYSSSPVNQHTPKFSMPKLSFVN